MWVVGTRASECRGRRGIRWNEWMNKWAWRLVLWPSVKCGVCSDYRSICMYWQFILIKHPLAAGTVKLEYPIQKMNQVPFSCTVPYFKVHKHIIADDIGYQSAGSSDHAYFSIALGAATLPVCSMCCRYCLLVPFRFLLPGGPQPRDASDTRAIHRQQTSGLL